MSSFTAMFDHPSIHELVTKIDEAFAKLPKLPAGITNFLVSVAPYLAMIGAVLSFIAGPLMALVSIVSLLTLSPTIILTTVVTTVLMFVQAVILFTAYKPLKAREYQGWYLLFVSNLLSIATSVVSLVMAPSGIIGSLLGIFIGLYILFQMKPSYKKA